VNTEQQNMWNIPTTITQGDRVTWSQKLDIYNPATDTLSCFVRGTSPGLDLTGTPNSKAETVGSPDHVPRRNCWDFIITEAQSTSLAPGKYQAQFVIFEFSTVRKTLGIAELLVCAGFDNLTQIDFRSTDEKELAIITEAIAKLVSGAVSEYRIGDRMMRYQDLNQLTQRQQYLRNRIAKAKNPGSIGGRNVGIRFENS
jgi:hypothetical protein